jgi:3-oxoisoapionate decarboxylase
MLKLNKSLICNKYLISRPYLSQKKSHIFIFDYEHQMNKIGIDSNCLGPLNLKPHQILQWASDNGAEGVHFSAFSDQQREELSIKYLHELGKLARDLNLYIEWGCGNHIPFNVLNWTPRDLLPVNMRAAGEAIAVGTRILRSCSDEMVRAKLSNPTTRKLMKATVAELRRMIPMLRDNGIVLAIETNFEFTTFELLKIFDKCGVEPGDCLGICLDTRNLLTTLEDPILATARIAPWVVATHINDGGLVFSKEGLATFPSSLGSGVINLRRIVATLKMQKQDINFSIRSHGESFLLPIHEPWYISQFKDLTIEEYNNLMLLETCAEEKLEARELVFTSDDDWTAICEARTRSDLTKLKEIVASC